MGPGPLIAIDVVLLYTLLGPLVLFGIYALFDALSGRSQQPKEKDKAQAKDLALLSPSEIDAFFR